MERAAFPGANQECLVHESLLTAIARGKDPPPMLVLLFESTGNYGHLKLNIIQRISSQEEENGFY